MNGSKPIYYWDTCIFFAWLKDENRPDEEIEAIECILKLNKQGKNIIMTSTITITELLESKISKQSEELFMAALKRPNITRIPTLEPIAYEARRIRDFYYNQRDRSGKTLSTPDSLHLATAIIYEADEFHSFDEKDNKNTLGLLPLSGNVAGANLTICKPYMLEDCIKANKHSEESRKGPMKFHFSHYRKSKYENGWLIGGRSGGAIFVG